MSYFLHRLWWPFKLLPKRVSRWLANWVIFCPWRLSWWQDFAFLSLDLLLIFDLYELFSNSLALRTRPLEPREEAVLRKIYGDSLPYSLIRLDTFARLGPPQYNFCYVSFHTINSWGPMDTALLVHEAMHIWQYGQYGAAYIPRALAAQRTALGYDYGGEEPLRRFPSLRYFNYEQQADIVADAYRSQAGLPLRWAKGGVSPSLFAPFLAEIRSVLS